MAMTLTSLKRANPWVLAGGGLVLVLAIAGAIYMGDLLGSGSDAVPARTEATAG